MIRISLILLLLLSCSSRKTKTSISTEESSSKIEQNSSVNSNVKIDRKDLEKEKKEVSKFSLVVKNNTTSTEKNNCPQTKNVQLRDKDGNEAIIPVNENSEINLNSESLIEEKLKKTELELADKTIENNNLIAENEFLKKEKSKETERIGVTLWQLILIIIGSAIVGIIIWELIKSKVT